MKLLHRVKAHDSYVLGLKFTQDGRHLYSAGMDNVVKVWSTGTWMLSRTFEGHTKSVNCFTLTPDEATLITGSSDNTVRVWDTASGETRLVLQDRKRVVSSLSVSSDGEWIAAGSYKGRAAVWTLGGEPVAAFPASKHNLSATALSPTDRSILATSGLGSAIEVWNLPSGDHLATLAVSAAAVMRLAYTPDGQHLVALTYEGALHTWAVDGWQPTGKPAPSVPGARAFALDRTGERVVVLSEGRVQIWSYPDWALLDEQQVRAKVLNGAAFAPTGQLLAVGAADRTVRLFDLTSES